jgi:3-hydroxyisobutyrate dehydrogenase
LDSSVSAIRVPQSRVASSERVTTPPSEALDPFRATAVKVATSPRELGEGLDVLATCVFDAAGTNEILFGDSGAAKGMQRDGVIIVHSTVSPNEIVTIADRAWTDHGLRVLDSPVSGGSERAAAGQMVTMVGGPVDVYERCLPILETFSELVVHLGQVGAGQHAKLINNALDRLGGVG